MSISELTGHDRSEQRATGTVPAGPPPPGAVVPVAHSSDATTGTAVNGAGAAGLFRRLDERFSGLTILLVLVDVVSLAGATILFGLPPAWTAMLAAFQLISRSSARVYRRRLRLSYFDDLPRSLSSTAAGFGLAAAMLVLTDDLRPINAFAHSLVAFLLASEVLRGGVFPVARWARRRFGRGERTVVLGACNVGVELVRNMIEHPEFGLRPIGFVDRHPQFTPEQLPAPLLSDTMTHVVVEHRINTVLLAFTGDRDSELVDAAMMAHRQGCSMLLVPRLYELYHDAPDVERLRSYPLVRLTTDPTRRPSWIVKRAVDALLAMAALVVLFPLLVVVSLAVLGESGRPIIFRQERIGMDGAPFKIYKLRSITPSNTMEEQTTWSVAGDTRIGPVGRFIRRTSLDELPQLWNIVRGEMSLVGPRPERPGFVRQFSASHARYWARHRVPSGLTGLAQINGLRGDTSIADRARYDNYYIANWSLWLDLKIVLLTARELLRRGEH